jgi:VIT1/CCC1 family predicted Fe2+/Mn2+ transporter
MSLSTRSAPNGRVHASEEPSLGELTSRLSEQVSRLVRDELALAQMEAKEKAKRLGVGFGMFGAGGVLAFFGGGVAVAAAVLGLTYVVAPWLAAVIVGAALFVLAAIASLLGRRSVKRGTPPVPTRAVASTKADVAAVREAVHPRVGR